MTDSSDQATFSSTWGAVFATAGVAIGLGNIWRFPYMMGKYGGGAFLLTYLLIIAAFGIPALMTEWALGRHTQAGPWRAFGRVGMPGARAIGIVLLLTVTMAGAYYGVILAWVLQCACRFAAVSVGVDTSTDFVTLTSGFGAQCAWVSLTVFIGCTALHFGVRSGIERVSRVVLPIFFAMFIVLIFRVLSLEGATAGITTLFSPRWADMTPATPLAAMGQAFFSLGLGGTFMVTYGSYMRRDVDIPRTAVMTAGMDAAAAVMAGLIIVPSAFVFNIPLNSGPPLMFEVMPAVFRNMPAGASLGAVFFGSIFMVAMLSLMAAYEVMVTALRDALGWSRTRALVAVLIAELVLAVPALRIGSYIEYSDLIWGTTMQPVGGVIAIVALAWFMKRAAALEEIGRNTKLPLPGWLFYWIKYGIPLGITATLAYGWVSR